MSKRKHTQNEELQKHTPVEPWGQKSIKKRGIIVRVDTKGRTLFDLAKNNAPVYRWFMRGVKNVMKHA